MEGRYLKIFNFGKFQFKTTPLQGSHFVYTTRMENDIVFAEKPADFLAKIS